MVTLKTTEIPSQGQVSDISSQTVYAWRFQLPGSTAPLNFMPFPEALADRLSDGLWGLDGVLSVEVHYQDNVDSEPVPARLEVMSTCPDWNAAYHQWLKLVEAPEFSEFMLTGPVPIHPEDWAESWKRFWHVTHITERLTICPSWESYTPTRADEVVLHLDPGSAFGTGAHETTRLMLQGLETLSQTRNLSQCSVLDVGTGSGILAIAAARLGCPSVIGIDNDPGVLSSATENAERNGVAHALTLSATPLQDLCRTRHDIILANIIALVILDLWPDMIERLASGGVLHLSGLIEKNLPDIEAAILGSGLTRIQTAQSGHWFWVAATKNS